VLGELNTPSIAAIYIAPFEKGGNPLVPLSINTSFSDRSSPIMLPKVKILNNSSRTIEAFILYSDLLEVQYVKNLFKPYETRIVETSIRLRVFNLTIPYTGENRSVMVTPDFFDVCTYPVLHRTVRARCVAYIDAFESVYIRSLAIREMFVMRNATLLVIDFVLENRYSRPISVSLTLFATVNGRSSPEWSAHIKGVKVKPGEPKVVTLRMRMGEVVDEYDNLRIYAMLRTFG